MSIEFSSLKTTPIQAFLMAWRWQEPNFDPLPPDVLESMRFLDEESSRVVDLHARQLINEVRHGDGVYAIAASITDLNDQSDATVSRTLKQAGPKEDGLIAATWAEHLSVLLPWRVVRQYWRAFFYPVSDDVVMFTESDDVVLMYAPHDELQIARLVQS